MLQLAAYLGVLPDEQTVCGLCIGVLMVVCLEAEAATSCASRLFGNAPIEDG